jgi:hypothetical protein
LFGRAGNNPYCHHRALELSQQGLRERISQVEKAPGTSFDHGRFELILENADGTAKAVDKLPLANNLIQITSTRPKTKRTLKQKKLVLCRGCHRHVFAGTKICPFCDGNIRSLANRYARDLREAKKAYHALVKLLPPHIETYP